MADTSKRHLDPDDRFGEDFRLRVLEIVREYVETRELTISEARKIEEAIRGALEIIVSKRVESHRDTCSTDRNESCRTKMDALHSTATSEIDAQIQAAVDRMLNRIYLLVGIVVPIVSAIISAVFKFIF